MAGPSTSVPRPLVVGANHRSSSMMLRDRLFIEDAALPAFLDRLRRAGLSQAIVLSTCDRVEVQAHDADPETASQAIIAALAEEAEVAADELNGQVYVHTGRDAVRQAFLVAASLDSLMIGEPQVFGQVKASHRMSRDAAMTGPELEAMLQAAYATAKRVRNETAIGRRPVSIASVAVQLARELHGDLGRSQGLLIGVGDMGELVAADLIAGGLGGMRVTHPTDVRAGAVARALGCHTAPFDDLVNQLAEADIVLSCMGTRRQVLNAEMVADALKKRRRKPMFLIDTAIPGDIDPAVERIDGAFLYDLNDLEQVAMEGRSSRQGEAEAALAIVEAEVDAYVRARAERAAVPTLTQLRDRFEAVRGEVLRDSGGDADKATRLLVSRLLHGPSAVLRQTVAEQNGEWRETERVLRRVFDLDDDDRGNG